MHNMKIKGIKTFKTKKTEIFGSMMKSPNSNRSTLNEHGGRHLGRCRLRRGQSCCQRTAAKGPMTRMRMAVFGGFWVSVEKI